jgi:hypothetical protein
VSDGMNRPVHDARRLNGRVLAARVAVSGARLWCPRRAARGGSRPRAEVQLDQSPGAGTAAAVTSPFHLAVPVNNLIDARAFYGE